MKIGMVSGQNDDILDFELGDHSGLSSTLMIL